MVGYTNTLTVKMLCSMGCVRKLQVMTICCSI